GHTESGLFEHLHSPRPHQARSAPRFSRRVRFDYASAFILDGGESCAQAESGYAFPSVVPVNEETGYPPEFLSSIAEIQTLVCFASVQSWEFGFRTVLDPANRSLAGIDDYAVCSSFLDERFLCLLVFWTVSFDEKLSLGVVEHAPASAPDTVVFCE